MISKKKKRHKLLTAKTWTVVLVILLFLSSWSVYKEIKSQQEIRNEIKYLENEYYSLEEQNLKSTQQLKYYRSNEFIEREAREKLNMARKGEHVVLITQSNIDDISQAMNTGQLKNWQLWIKYFFGVNN